MSTFNRVALHPYPSLYAILSLLPDVVLTAQRSRPVTDSAIEGVANLVPHAVFAEPSRVPREFVGRHEQEHV